MASIAQSCLLLSAGPNKLAIIPLGVVKVWYFKACNRLCPLCKIRWFTFGLQQGRTVPSINPQTLSSAAPFRRNELAKAFKQRGLNQLWFKSLILVTGLMTGIYQVNCLVKCHT